MKTITENEIQQYKAQVLKEKLMLHSDNHGNFDIVKTKEKKVTVFEIWRDADECNDYMLVEPSDYPGIAVNYPTFELAFEFLKTNISDLEFIKL